MGDVGLNMRSHVIKVDPLGKPRQHEDEYVLTIFTIMDCARTEIYNLHS